MNRISTLTLTLALIACAGDTQETSDTGAASDTGSATDTGGAGDTGTTEDTGTPEDTAVDPLAHLPEGALLYFPLDGSPDDLVQGIAGTADAGAISGVDRFGNPDAAYCFAMDQVITVADGSNLDDFDGVTVAGFIKQTGFVGGNQPVVHKWTYRFDSEQYGWFVNGGDNLIAVGRANNNGTRDNADMALDYWYHVAVTYDKATQQQVIYVNGRPTSDITSGAYGLSDGTEVDLKIGGIVGCLDDVVVYDRALPLADIETLAADLVGAPPVPTMLFPFDGSPDEVREGYVGTAESDVVLTTDRHGNADSAYGFSGGYISYDEPSDLNVWAGVSISAWVRQDSLPTSTTQMVAKWNYSRNSEQYGLFLNGPRHLIAIGRADYNGSSDTGVAETGRWYHVAMTYDKASGRERIYVDGTATLERTALAYTNGDGQVLPLKIGGVDGALDDVMIFDRELSLEEVQALAE